MTKDRDICREYHSGQSLREVASNHGISYETVRRIVQDAGGETRGPGVVPIELRVTKDTLDRLFEAL